ncbi:MAG: amidohydrolase family protein [Planctomycetota bacterium]
MLVAQVRAPSDAPRPSVPDVHILENVRIVVSPGSVIERGTIVIQGDRILSVGQDVRVDRAAIRRDLSGLTVHAAFLDAYVPVPVDEAEVERPNRHWHPSVRPDRSVLAGSGISEGRAKSMRTLGFGAAALHPEDGIFRGRSAIVTLEEPVDGSSRRVVRNDVAQTIAFDRSPDGYPRSTMGTVALIRQSLLDGRFGRETDGVDAPSWAQAMASEKTVFVPRNELEALDIARLRAEFEELGDLILVGSGTEFRRLDALEAFGRPIILPLDLPDRPDVFDERSREAVSLRQLQTWEQGPTNAARLRLRGLPLLLTTTRSEPISSFWDSLEEALDAGLSTDDALAALTTEPAQQLGVSDVLGSVQAGKLANLCVVEGDPLDPSRTLKAVWINGVEHDVEEREAPSVDGAWTLSMPDGAPSVESLEIRGSSATFVLDPAADDPVRVSTKFTQRDRTIELRASDDALEADGVFTFTALLRGERLHGVGTAPDGNRFAWTAERSGDLSTEDEATDEATTPSIDFAPLPTPLGAFGRLDRPAQQSVRVRGATVWTSGPDGTLTDATLIVSDGKVEYVGSDTDAPDFDVDLEVDGRGLHITPGLIDCHSHTGIRGGVNEGTQTVTSEVRIGDALDPDDVNWYRQLAGGVTAVNQLHGSANPIGGQNHVVKLRWGVADPHAMDLQGAPSGIKFALGENVKRSRSSRNTRYPNTRMGVEAVLRERFEAARRYASEGPANGRDLELEALADILRGDRLVHCHSYRQDEILMLCRMADEFGFRIGTLQHGLEAYKVADAVRQSSRGASIFSDWWAYKYEVVDAIPQAAGILTEQGVVVSFNSDSNELARHLNTEAAKGVHYGGMSEVTALKLVTLNPAIQLGIADRVGSLEVGKDGDFVVWSGNPMGSFTRCLETWIEGRREWSEDEDRRLQTVAAEERNRLIQKLLSEGFRGDERGIESNPEERNKPGDCGCARLDGLTEDLR